MSFAFLLELERKTELLEISEKHLPTDHPDLNDEVTQESIDGALYHAAVNADDNNIRMCSECYTLLQDDPKEFFDSL